MITIGIKIYLTLFSSHRPSPRDIFLFKFSWYQVRTVHLHVLSVRDPLGNIVTFQQEIGLKRSNLR